MPLLLVWMNVSSLTPWLFDFHTVQFSGSSGYFLFLNLLLPFFSGFARRDSVSTLCLHLGQKLQSLVCDLFCWSWVHMGEVKLHTKINSYQHQVQGQVNKRSKAMQDPPPPVSCSAIP